MNKSQDSQEDPRPPQHATSSNASYHIGLCSREGPREDEHDEPDASSLHVEHGLPVEQSRDDNASTHRLRQVAFDIFNGVHGNMDGGDGTQSHGSRASVIANAPTEPSRSVRRSSQGESTGTVVVGQRPEQPAVHHNMPFGTLFSPWIAPAVGVPAIATDVDAFADLRADKPTQDEMRMATQPRRILIGVICFLYLMSFVFLFMVQLGSTSNQAALTGIFFYRFNVTSIFPSSTADSALADAVAREVGLRDFYQVGLWGYCEGNRQPHGGSGVDFTDCSRPRSFYWFNPKDIILNELLAGSSIVFPNNALTVLSVLRVIMQVMFGTFLLGTVLNFLLLLASPVVLLSRWYSLLISFLAGLSALLTLTGATIATVVTLAFRIGVSAITEVDVGLTIGRPMFVFVWTSTGLGLAAFILHSILGCCSASIRDIETGHVFLVRPTMGRRTSTRRVVRPKATRNKLRALSNVFHLSRNVNVDHHDTLPDALPMLPLQARATPPDPSANVPPPPAYSRS